MLSEMIYSESIGVVMPGTEHLEKGRLLLGAHALEFTLGYVHLAPRDAPGAAARDAGVRDTPARNALLGILSLA